MLVKLRRFTEIGMPETVRYASANRRNAIDDSGSRSSTGFVVGGVKARIAFCRPSPIRTRAKSSWAGRRSHRRLLMAIDHSQPGCGLSHSTCRRCSSAVARASLRSCAM